MTVGWDRSWKDGLAGTFHTSLLGRRVVLKLKFLGQSLGLLHFGVFNNEGCSRMCEGLIQIRGGAINALVVPPIQALGRCPV